MELSCDAKTGVFEGLVIDVLEHALLLLLELKVRSHVLHELFPFPFITRLLWDII